MQIGASTVDAVKLGASNVDAIYLGSAQLSGAGGGGGEEEENMPSVATKTLSSANILSLSVTPIEVVPAPGAGKVIDIIEMWVTYLFGTNPYVNGGNPNCGFFIEDQDINVNLTDFSNILLGVEGGHGFGLSAQESQSFNPNSDIDNKAIMFGSDTDAFTGGDGTAVVGCTYRVFDLATGLLVP